MNENELIQAIAAIMDEALKSPTMNSEVSQERILTVISYSALLHSTDKEGEDGSTFQRYINTVFLPYVKVRDKNNTDVYSICKMVVEDWYKSKQGLL